MGEKRAKPLLLLPFLVSDSKWTGVFFRGFFIKKKIKKKIKHSMWGNSFPLFFFAFVFCRFVVFVAYRTHLLIRKADSSVFNSRTAVLILLLLLLFVCFFLENRLQ